MFLASKIVLAGVAFTLITTGIVLRSLPRSATRTTGSDSNKEGVVAVDQTEIKAMQETLLKKGDYQGKIDGVFGLQTRAGIRAYQKAENLPETGELDTQTADKLRVKPEGRVEPSYETTKDKPSAYIPWAKGSERKSKRQRRAGKTVAATEGTRGDREETPQAESDNRPE
jgi:peptidoglycan hydrolase-like protein with peptidoglycan-binding domain